MARVSPGQTAGRGLKRVVDPGAPQVQHVSPGQTAGRGLKQCIAWGTGAYRQVSPGQTAGRGLKQKDRRGQGSAQARIARPNRRARIETPRRTSDDPCHFVSPGQTAGRGLKLNILFIGLESIFVSPGQTAGRGLKLTVVMFYAAISACIARPNRRARIETPLLRSENCLADGIARPNRRARIETIRDGMGRYSSCVSPGQTAGRGLKQAPILADHLHPEYRPAKPPGAD